jgi:hypothetical protein
MLILIKLLILLLFLRGYSAACCMASYDSITVDNDLETICKQMAIQKTGETTEKYLKITHDTMFLNWDLKRAYIQLVF